MIVSMCVIGFVVLLLFFNERSYYRNKYLQEYTFPIGLKRRFVDSHPNLNAKQTNLVFEGLRQFFQICASCNSTEIAAMPSRIVDDAWHEFILCSQAYSDFCEQALGRFLHHTPKELMSEPSKLSLGVKNTWRKACSIEGIDPRKPKSLPLLFAIDGLLNIPDGYLYTVDCKMDGSEHEHCVSDIGCGSSGGCGGDGGCGGCGGCGGGG